MVSWPSSGSQTNPCETAFSCFKYGAATTMTRQTNWTGWRQASSWIWIWLKSWKAGRRDLTVKNEKEKRRHPAAGLNTTEVVPPITAILLQDLMTVADFTQLDVEDLVVVVEVLEEQSDRHQTEPASLAAKRDTFLRIALTKSRK